MNIIPVEIKKIIVKWIIKILPETVINEIQRPIKAIINSYSQEGEDTILERIFAGKRRGFYVDIGAHHPIRFSNTYKFYLKGWQGINIDAMPGSMDIFTKIRPKDINLEIPISQKKEKLIYYIFDESALNTLSEKLAKKRQAENKYTLINKIYIQTDTLESILNKHCPKNQVIDFMTVDVEGYELDVLMSNDWSKYKPEVVLVEYLESSIENALNSDIYLYLNNLGYQFYSMTYNTMIFKNEKR